MKMEFTDNVESLSLEEINDLPILEKPKYYMRYLSDVIEKNKELGVSIKDLEKITNLNETTLAKYLGILFSQRRIYRIRRGNTVLYYPNGRVHTFLSRDIVSYDERNNQHKHHVSLLKNPAGSFVYIQEKELDENGFEIVIAGILVPKSALTMLIEQLGKAKDELEETELEE